MTKQLVILGSTGSIGRQTLDVARHLPVRIRALAAGSNVELLAQQCREYRPDVAVMATAQAARELRERLDGQSIEILVGEEGMIEAARLPGADTVVTSVVGMLGLRPTLAAIRAGKRIGLANKETMVCAGSLVMAEAARYGAEIIPVDSEHSAIFQCLLGCRDRSQVKKLILTCSGGPFYGMDRAALEKVTVADALRHPNWHMGPKITVDSATLMNKGLEFIEAMRLFGVTPDDIQVVVHPQSVIHSMVELVDGTVIAQLGVPDMGLPIQLALTWPERCPSMFDRLDFTKLGALTFEAPDLENFPCLRLAMDCARRGGTAGCVMSAANEEAVHLFLKEKLGFNRIYDMAAAAVEKLAGADASTLDVILDADAAARRYVHETVGA